VCHGRFVGCYAVRGLGAKEGAGSAFSLLVRQIRGDRRGARFDSPTSPSPWPSPPDHRGRGDEGFFFAFGAVKNVRFADNGADPYCDADKDSLKVIDLADMRGGACDPASAAVPGVQKTVSQRYERLEAPIRLTVVKKDGNPLALGTGRKVMQGLERACLQEAGRGGGIRPCRR